MLKKNINEKIRDVLNITTVVFIAAKYEEIYPPDISDYIYLAENKITSEQILEREFEILDELDFELHICSPYLFLTKYCYERDLEKKEKNLILLHWAQFILDICNLEVLFCEYKPSLQAAVSLYLAKNFSRKSTPKKKDWTAQEEFITGYSENEIKKKSGIAVSTVARFFRKEIIQNNSALIKKYESVKYSAVAFEFEKSVDSCNYHSEKKSETKSYRVSFS